VLCVTFTVSYFTAKLSIAHIEILLKILGLFLTGNALLKKFSRVQLVRFEAVLLDYLKDIETETKDLLSVHYFAEKI